MRIFKIISLIFLIIVTNSCINLKSDYPDIQFYNISPDFDSIKSDFQIPGSIFIRQFSSGNAYDTDYFIASTGENKIKKYFYHRWTDNFNNLATDYFIQTFTRKKIFSDGVYESTSYIIPDFVLEGHIIEILAHNDLDNNENNYASISINLSFINRGNKLNEPVKLFNKEFSAKVKRPNKKVSTIAPAFDSCMTIITNKLIKEISHSLK